jgi:hypothetical protein
MVIKLSISGLFTSFKDQEGKLMTEKIDKVKTKRLSKSERTHIRRVKQEARKSGPAPR